MKMITDKKETSSGYNAWLDYPAIKKASACNGLFKSLCVSGNDPLLEPAKIELKNALKSMLGQSLRMVNCPALKGTILLEIISEKSVEESLVSEKEKEKLGKEGYLIKNCNTLSGSFIYIAGKSAAGVLYGVFGFLRLLQCGTFSEVSYILENPFTGLRMLNQWDNMDGSIERGYAGQSIFYNNGQIVFDFSRIRDYARLMASVGLNGIVINNVNVHKNETHLITKRFLPQVAKIAEIFRQYGIKTFLSVNYCSPMELGGLTTADPFDHEVLTWWCKNVTELYSYIPDFGGFLVKADSEFRPGPFTYGRNHADGANMLAKALNPYGGLVIWRCFVYNCTQDWRDRTTDRANSAYDNFMPLDGLFKDNVLLQIKNGPMDFQVREPVSPLICRLKKTNILLELQITQEYTGQQKHLCFLAPLWKEVLDFDTYKDGIGTTVSNILSEYKSDGCHFGMTGVSNIGSDSNWTGHDLAQANLYSYGRLTWNPDLSSKDIATEWIKQTYGSDSFVVDTVLGMLLESYPIYESYTSPLGIGWMVNPSHHYGPSVEGYEYSAWGTYHRADCTGIGVDRSVAAGTGNAGRYNAPTSALYENPDTCPEELLLFFHHVSYQHRLKSGIKLIQYIYDSHFEGADKAALLVERWKTLEDHIPHQAFTRVLKKLQEQSIHACEWRDVVNSYFYRKSGIPDEKNRPIY